MSVEVTTLKNGLRVVSDHIPHVETVTVGVWVDVGSRCETASENGLSHMLEHMAFKGTKTRSAYDIAEEIENAGGYLNAYTSKEHTTYYARLLKEDLKLGVNVLSDILQNSIFAQEELDRERGVVIQEIGQAEDTPDDIVFDLMQQMAYNDHPLGRPILGTVDLVNGFSRDDLAKYMSSHYKSENMVVVAAGNLQHGELVKLVEDSFDNLDQKCDQKKEPAKYTGGDNRIQRDLEQINLLLGFDGMSFSDPDYFSSHIMAIVFGGGMSSRLFQEIREKRGLVYSIYSYLGSFVDTGTFGIHAGTGPEQITELVPVIADEFHKMTHTVKPKEVERAKAQIKTGIMMSLENTTSRMEQLGRQQLIFGRHVPREETLAKIEKVDAEAVMKCAKRLLDQNKLSLGAIGPIGKLDGYDKISGYF